MSLSLCFAGEKCTRRFMGIINARQVITVTEMAQDGGGRFGDPDAQMLSTACS
jgi:hypothetical protein